MSLLENPSQLVLKQKHLLHNHILLVCPRADNLAAEIHRQVAAARASVLTWDYVSFKCHETTTDASFSVQPPAAWQPDHLIIFMPKTKSALPLILASLGDRVNKADKIWLVGEKKEGVESAARNLVKKVGTNEKVGTNGEAKTGPVTADWKARKLASARHSQLWEITPVTPFTDEIGRHWQQKVIDVPKAGALELCWFPGVFSVGRLDSGTQLLLANLPGLLGLRHGKPARILDFGCGCGVIGFCLQRLYPQSQVEMVDVNLLAIESARRSAALNALQVKIFPSAGLQEVKKGLSAIVTNPPFHQGIKMDTGITHQFLQDCASHLLQGGSLTLVANRFLPYAEWINKYVGKTTVLAEDSRFKIYHAVKAN